ncbi:Retrotransposon-like protein 1 [Merluccius polli]|uniref:Retrotransposon-like protein 1 n=1 Tax=Merluccius polli TaxID=89951 RepID=A0AA47P526_MERPO|nr:Retrotransposon-like protein 1 [Merluccius polli]
MMIINYNPHRDNEEPDQNPDKNPNAGRRSSWVNVVWKWTTGTESSLIPSGHIRYTGPPSTVVQSLVCGGFFRDLKVWRKRRWSSVCMSSFTSELLLLFDEAFSLFLCGFQFLFNCLVEIIPLLLNAAHQRIEDLLTRYNRMGLVVRRADLAQTHLVSLAEELKESVVFLTHPVFQTVHRLDQQMFPQACDSLMWLQLGPSTDITGNFSLCNTKLLFDSGSVRPHEEIIFTRLQSEYWPIACWTREDRDRYTRVPAEPELGPRRHCTVRSSRYGRGSRPTEGSSGGRAGVLEVWTARSLPRGVPPHGVACWTREDRDRYTRVPAEPELGPRRHCTYELASMDPADTEAVRRAISHQHAQLGQHDQALQEITSSLRELSLTITSRLPVTPEPPAPVPSHSASPRELFIPAPERYKGDLGLCRSFLLQCSLVFELQPQTYPTDKARIAYLIGALRGEALAWATAVWERGSAACFDYSVFTEEMRRVFDHPRRLIRSRVSDSCGWNVEALQGVFLNALGSDVEDELTSREESADLEHLIALAIRTTWAGVPNMGPAEYKESVARQFWINRQIHYGSIKTQEGKVGVIEE